MKQQVCKRSRSLFKGIYNVIDTQRILFLGSTKYKSHFNVRSVLDVGFFSRYFVSHVSADKGNGHFPVLPTDLSVASKIQGDESQILQITLEPGQTIRAESGAMLFMTQGIEMLTTMGEGGMTSGFKRILSGQNLFLSDFSYKGTDGSIGTVCLGTDFPSKIIKLDLREYGGKLVCQKGAYLAGGLSVQIDVEFVKKMTTGFFGGEGFLLQSISGDDYIFIKAGGTLVKKELKPGECLRISSGCLVAFTKDVDFDVQMMSGFKNVMFGGEGLFVTTVTGPGIVWLQGMPPNRMVSEIVRRLPSRRGHDLGIPIDMGSGGTDSQEDDRMDESEDSLANDDYVEKTDITNDIHQQTEAISSSSGEEFVDSESSKSLFGDASFEDQHVATENTISHTDDFGDATKFSTENDAVNVDEKNVFDDFLKDETSFPSNDEFSSNDEFYSEDNHSASEIPDDDDEGISSLLGKIWDIFNNDD